MKQIKKILATTDLSDLARHGLRIAFETARDRSAEVIIYHVISYEDGEFPVHHGAEEWVQTAGADEQLKELIDDRRHKLEQYLNESFPHALSNLKIRLEVEVGLPDKMIVEKAAAEAVDLIVMSTHGRSGLRRFLIGSVTEKVLRQAACPVLSVPPSENS